MGATAKAMRVGRVRSALAVASASAVLLALPAGASAGEYLRGFAESSFTSGNAADRTFWLDQSVRANSSIVRLNLPWRSLAGGKPVSPTDPADPSYNFTTLDRAVTDAAVRGQRILLTIYDAPAYAIGRNESSEALPGTWKPDPDALGDFAQAVASRYSGGFTPAGEAGSLPKVGYLEVWNEPNLSEYLSPQYTKKSTFAGDHYREMVNAFYKGVSKAGGGAKVVAGVTAPYGDPVGGLRTRPLRFQRDFMCLDSDLKARKKCGTAKFDILSHHPITLSGGPNKSAIDPDDVAMPDFKNIVKTLRAAEKQHTAKGSKHHPAWATEFWWESNPPDKSQGVPVARHARWVEESLYSLWKQGASAAIWLLLADVQAGDDGFSGQQSGLFFFDRSEKPAFTAFRFPFVGDRKSKKRVDVWTVPPATGTLEVEQKVGDEFRSIGDVEVRDGVPETIKVNASSEKIQLRGVIDGETSLTYTTK